jgi:hypothetical protein
VLRREVQALDKDQPLYNIRTYNDVVKSSLGTRRISMQLFTVFACAALLLAAVGISRPSHDLDVHRWQPYGCKVSRLFLECELA